MKKLLFIGLLLPLTTVKLYSQSFPKPEIKVSQVTEDNLYGRWIDDKGTIMKIEKLSPVAINEAIRQTKKLLLLIDADYNQPANDLSFYYDEIREENVSRFFTYAFLEKSNVSKVWKGVYKDVGYEIFLVIKNETVGVIYRATL